MDAATVRGLLLVTLDADTKNRMGAELQLKQVESQGLIEVLLDMLQSEQDSNIRLSAVIYLKNRVFRGWKLSEIHPDERLITDAEKERVRARLLPVLAMSEGPVRVQIVDVVRRILIHDFPDEWPNFFNFTLELLNTNDRPSVLTGLECLLALCHINRFKSSDSDNRELLDKMVESAFPRLLAICNELVNQDGDEAGEMLQIALKSYKCACWLELPKVLQQQPTIIAWCEVFLRTISKPFPASVMAESDPLEREKHHWAKAKKRATLMLDRLFSRYGSTASTNSNTSTDLVKFAKVFTSNIAPEVMRHYLQEVEKWVSKSIWLSRPCLYWIVVFLRACIKPKETWIHLSPHLSNLVTHFLFPILCLSPEDMEKFDDEPEEFLHGRFYLYDEQHAPDLAAQQFLVDLTKYRRKETFEILKFINTVVAEYEVAPAEKKNHVAKEGALRMISTLATVILGKNSPIAGQVESFLVRFVFPDFKSSHGYLRARACDTIEKFEQLEFQDQQNIVVIYRHILDCMVDTALPVRVTAALALQPLIRHDVVRENMKQSIPTIMQQLLKLANEADVEALANIMEEFVETFATELTPFAVAICQQLRDTYLRIVSEVLATRVPSEVDEYDFADDKVLNALSVLQTIGTLILTLESTPDILSHIESVLMPIVTITLEYRREPVKRLPELYNEVFEIIDSCTFAAKTISPNMWKAFELIMGIFETSDDVFLEDMLPSLENFIHYGAAYLMQKPNYVDSLYLMVSASADGAKISGTDKICAAKLAENMMLSLRGHIDKFVLGFIEIAMMTLQRITKESKSVSKVLPLHMTEMVLNAIYYDPLLALQILEGKGWTVSFFCIWLEDFKESRFPRVHDIKLCILAIAALLTVPAEHIPESIVSKYLVLMSVAARLFKVLPVALNNRENALREDFHLDAGSFGYADSDDWDDDGAGWDEDGRENDVKPEETTTDIKDEDSAYLEFLQGEAQKLSSARQEQENISRRGGNVDVDDDDDDDEALGEESIPQDSPLDKIDPYQVFCISFKRLLQEQPQLYSRLISAMPSDQQLILQTAIGQAEDAANKEAQQIHS